MTMQQLSKHTVKIQLTAEEVLLFLPNKSFQPESPQMMRLLSFLLEKAEEFCNLTFSERPVSAELMHTPDGGLIVYYTAQTVHHPSHKPHKVIQLAVLFIDNNHLELCCKRLLGVCANRAESALFLYREALVLLLTIPSELTMYVQHICMEYGKPVASTPFMRAKLAEYGKCQYASNAVAAIAQVS